MKFRYFLVYLWFSTLMVLTASRTLCPRIFFQNIDEDKMPFKLIEGVFVKQSYTYNSFPVYQRENDNLLLYYQTYTGGGSMVFGLKLAKYFGVACTIQTGVSPLLWLASSDILDRNDVFSGLISKWVFWNDRDKTNYFTRTPPTIKAICVDEDFRECNSDRVYMNVNFNDGKGNILNNATQDYFSRIPGLFHNLRPVYKHTIQQWYLQYTADHYWLVTSTYIPSGYTDSGAVMRVNDLALRPEYITKIWSVHYNYWRENYSLKVRCRGVNSMTNKCSESPCRRGSSCVYTSGNETLCICAPGYTGIRCDINKQCSSPQSYHGKEWGFYFSGKRPGDLALTFCQGSYPSEQFAICEDETFGSYWTRQGRLRCKASNRISTPTFIPFTPFPTYKPRSYTPDSKPINFDDIPGLMPGILVTAILLQIFLPFILWCCAYCRKSCKEAEEQEEDERRRRQFEEEEQRRLELITRAESREELNQGVQNYREAVEQHQMEVEETEVKRKKGFYRNASMWRLASMHMYFSFFLWLIYLLVWECTEFKGVIFFILYIMAIIMLIIAPIIVLIESAFSHELDYIKNIMEDESAWSYIHRMQQVAPILTMKVECYHWETRTRVVYYTDANGNTQSRTETYQERVVTFVDCDTFSYGSWVDVSKKEMPALSSVALTRLKIDLHILFGDEETSSEFLRQKEDMLERNRHKDVYMDFFCDEEVPGLAKRISAYVDLQLKPWWIRPMYFWLATLLFMTWPYRWLFRARTAKNYYDLKKKIYKSTTPPAEVDPMDPVALLQQSQVPMALQGYVNQSFSLSEIPSEPELPPYFVVAPNTSQSSPHLTSTPDSSLVPPYPFTAPYPSTNQGSGQAVPPSLEQTIPSGPPPSYDAAVNQNRPCAGSTASC